MHLTDSQKREAFYKAADVIEANPGLYNFNSCFVGEVSCEACMWGHIGRILNMRPMAGISKVAERFGFPEERLYYFGGDPKVETAQDAAKLMRAFADHHWPQSIIQHQPSDMSFKELLDSISAATT